MEKNVQVYKKIYLLYNLFGQTYILATSYNLLGLNNLRVLIFAKLIYHVLIFFKNLHPP